MVGPVQQHLCMIWPNCTKHMCASIFYLVLYFSSRSIMVHQNQFLKNCVHFSILESLYRSCKPLYIPYFRCDLRCGLRQGFNQAMPRKTRYRTEKNKKEQVTKPSNGWATPCERRWRAAAAPLSSKQQQQQQTAATASNTLYRLAR